jgi:FkbM family methyltransferase
VDVGANVGRYSEFLLANYSSFRFAFEPLPGAFERLKRQKQMFGPRVVLVNKGCADRSGSLELHFGVDSSELASFSPEVKEIDHVGKANVNSMIVEIISLDEFFDSSRSTTPTRCDLLKIDTKGFEYEVLKGALRFIENYRLRIIQIKFDLQNLF